MKWESLTPYNATALLANACEHALMDFKEKYDTSDPTVHFEISKDVSAFANHLGGTIVVGAIEGRGVSRGRIVRFAPIINPNPAALIQSVERAVRLYCAPVPIVDAIEIALDAAQASAMLRRTSQDTSVVAINVAPATNTPIGCAACDGNGKAIPDAYRFPLRTVTGTRLLRPEELARTMNITERRALLELQALAGEPKVSVWFNDQTGLRRHSTPCKIESIDADIMVCRLRLVYVAKAPPADIPLIFVRACWRSAEGWNVAIDGLAFEGVEDQRSGFFPPGAGH